MPDDDQALALTPEQQASKEAEWQKTLHRLGLDAADIANVRTTDILYLADNWQFLQVVEISGTRETLPTPECIIAKSGWTIINYGDAMATSPGKWIFRGGYFQWTENMDEADDDGSGGRGIVNPKHGTIHKQAFDSAAEIIQLAQQFGWQGVQIVDGHPNMQRAAWVEACRIGVRLDGYIPDMQAEKQRRRIVSGSVEEMLQVVKGLRG